MQTTHSFEASLDYARSRDEQDPLKSYREAFHIPRHSDGSLTIYMTGNSLGCQPKGVAEHIQMELKKWAEVGVEGHFTGDHPWTTYHNLLTDPMAEIVGGQHDEVVVMNTLTVNLHLMMVSFYQPKGDRNKILFEADAFPSDIYAIQSQIHWHGLNAEEAMLRLRPRAGEHHLRTEDIIATIETHGAEIALVLLPGVNYYTGQVFDIEKITEAAHAQGCVIGWDLAHAVGNVPLDLHDWKVDFACWCTYKYLNGSPGNLSGCFVHANHITRTDLPRFAGWWGHDKESRFQMDDTFIPIPTVEGWQLSNPPIICLAALRPALEMFEEVGMKKLREKSLQLTGYLRFLLESANLPLDIFTPSDPAAHGSQ